MIKTFVWFSIAFLLGGIAAVTYFSLFAPQHNDELNGNKQANYVSVSGNKYISVSQEYNKEPMKQIDSLTARSNEKFTRRNAIDHSSPVSFKQL